MSKLYTLKELFKGSLNPVFKFESEDPQNPLNILFDVYLESAAKFDKIILKRFGEWIFYVDDDLSLDDAQNDFRDTWESWATSHYDSLARIKAAYLEEYSPINNYDKMSETTTTFHGTETDTHTIGSGHLTSKTKTAPENNNVTYLTGENETNSDAQTNEDLKTFNDRYDRTIIHDVGNIGVMTSDAVLRDYLLQRWGLNFYLDVFENFIKEMAY